MNTKLEKTQVTPIVTPPESASTEQNSSLSEMKLDNLNTVLSAIFGAIERDDKDRIDDLIQSLDKKTLIENIDHPEVTRLLTEILDNFLEVEDYHTFLISLLEKNTVLLEFETDNLTIIQQLCENPYLGHEVISALVRNEALMEQLKPQDQQSLLAALQEVENEPYSEDDYEEEGKVLKSIKPSAAARSVNQMQFINTNSTMESMMIDAYFYHQFTDRLAQKKIALLPIWQHRDPIPVDLVEILKKGGKWHFTTGISMVSDVQKTSKNKVNVMNSNLEEIDIPSGAQYAAIPVCIGQHYGLFLLHLTKPFACYIEPLRVQITLSIIINALTLEERVFLDSLDAENRKVIISEKITAYMHETFVQHMTTDLGLSAQAIQYKFLGQEHQQNFCCDYVHEALEVLATHFNPEDPNITLREMSSIKLTEERVRSIRLKQILHFGRDYYLYQRGLYVDDAHGDSAWQAFTQQLLPQANPEFSQGGAACATLEESNSNGSEQSSRKRDSTESLGHWCSFHTSRASKKPRPISPSDAVDDFDCAGSLTEEHGSNQPTIGSD